MRMAGDIVLLNASCRRGDWRTDVITEVVGGGIMRTVTVKIASGMEFIRGRTWVVRLDLGTLRVSVGLSRLLSLIDLGSSRDGITCLICPFLFRCDSLVLPLPAPTPSPFFDSLHCIVYYVCIVVCIEFPPSSVVNVGFSCLGHLIGAPREALGVAEGRARSFDQPVSNASPASHGRPAGRGGSRGAMRGHEAIVVYGGYRQSGVVRGAWCGGASSVGCLRCAPPSIRSSVLQVTFFPLWFFFVLLRGDGVTELELYSNGGTVEYRVISVHFCTSRYSISSLLYCIPLFRL